MDRQKGLTGIYKITNLNNGHFYIGQSRNIHQRWKQHTSDLPEEYPSSRLRSAFGKYGFQTIVHKPGIYDNFKFEIIEFCDEEDLLEKESKYILKLKPDYNCSILTLGNHYIGNHLDKKRKSWIQYHNYDLEEGYPSQSILDGKKKLNLCDSHHYISTRKRSILYSQGDIIFLILGKTINKRKKYFLWTKTIVEEVDFLEKEDLIYNAFGEQCFIDPPQVLNDITGFDEFRKFSGNFGLGFQNITEWPFVNVLNNLGKKFKCKNEDWLTYKDYILDFEKNNP
jgi:group I intron endonuclease